VSARSGCFASLARGWDSKPIGGREVEGMGRAKGGKGERWKSERKGKEGGGEAGLRGSQAEVGWRVRVVLRLRSLSFIIMSIRHISTTQRRSINNNQSRRPGFMRCRPRPTRDSLSEFPACLMLYLSLTSSIKIPMRRLARSGAVLTETRLIGSSVRVVDGVLVDMMNRRDADADEREACARRSSLRLLLVIRCFRAVNIAERQWTILLRL
jgi:hypothetical protein